MFRESLEMRMKIQGKDHPLIALTYYGIGEALFGLKRYRETESEYERALGAMERTLGKNHPYTAFAATGLAKTRLALGRPKEALAPVEHALRLRQNTTMDPGEKGDTQWVAARIYWSLQRDPKRALRLAEQALQNFSELDRAKAGAYAEVHAWLTQHR